MLFPKTPAFCRKKILKLFLLHCTSVFMSSKKVSQILKILFQAGDTNIFVHRGVFFGRYVRLKSFFLMKKASAVKSEAHFCREAIEN